MAVDLSKMLPQEKLTEFNALSPDEKKQEIIEIGRNMVLFLILLI